MKESDNLQKSWKNSNIGIVQQYFIYIMASVLLVEETAVPGENH